MTDREFLQRRLDTLHSLTGAAVLTGGGSGGGLQNTLHGVWAAEARLLARILAEPGEVGPILAAWQERTHAFMARHPARAGWADAQGNAWDAAQVLSLLSDLQTRLEALRQPDVFEDEE